MIDKIGGYRRYNCKKCREGNHWVWSWSCVKTSKPGRQYRDKYDRGDIENGPYHYDGRLRKKDKPPYTRNGLAIREYRKPYSQLDPFEQEEIREDYNMQVERINGEFRLGPAVPQPAVDILVGKDRYWMSLSESLNDESSRECKRCGYSIAYCEPHWKIAKEHYGNTSGDLNYYHTWCYEI